MIVEVLRRNAKEINRKNSNRENVVELSWLFSNTPSPVNGIQANQSLNPSILSPLPAIPSILWPAMFKEQLIHLFTQFKDKIQCIHTLSAFEWGDLAFHTGPIFWSGSLSPSCQLLLKSRQSFSKEDSGNCLSETNNCGRIEVPRLITSVGPCHFWLAQLLYQQEPQKTWAGPLQGTTIMSKEKYSDKAHSRSKYECQDFSVPSTIISLYKYTFQRSRSTG